nr:MAG TPA: Protein of unknown function (DUF1804) [Caudoviricetes sp.]
MHEWKDIRNEYINGSISYRKLAEKHGISFNTLCNRAKKEEWVEKRKKQHDKINAKIEQKTVEKIAEIESSRIVRINAAADKLLAKLERATEELDTYLVKNKKKVRDIEYNYEVGKPSKEIIAEDEEIAVVSGNIDRAGLKQLTAALKDLADISNSGDEPDASEDRLADKLNEIFGGGDANTETK